MPNIDLPWRRKTPLERTQAEISKVQHEVAKQIDKVELPKVELPQLTSADISAAVDETKRAVSSGVEQVAAAAGQLGRKAGQVGRHAGRRGRELTGELAKVGDDVRSMRITREKRGPNMMPGIALLAGLGSGLAAMYFFDPEQGNRRRALLRDQLDKWTRVTRESVSGQMEDLRNRSAGLAHEVRKSVAGSDTGSEGSAEMPDASAELAATDQAADHAEPVTEPVGGSSWPQDVSLETEGQPEGRPH
ncbi:MAG TPA: hypothetical protein VMP67_06400 [Candidatus Limnocylindria bacterium]|nr:hypothetical protein [Candidatus Limnocylindria bacterium]